ncbi:MAG: rhodanese-like domain-containing protein [Desulfovibrio sp.]
MRWTMFFKPITSVTPEEGRKLIRDDDSLNLLDVRQPNEFKEGHISGAKLIPLPDLPDKMDSLDKNETLLVYCAIGGRSRIATQMLKEEGFINVINLKGGFKAYNGWTGYGEYEKGLELFPDDMSLSDTLHRAYAMEEALELFYISQGDKTSSIQVKNIFHQLALVETRHKSNILDTAEEMALEIDIETIDSTIAEAGMTTDDYLKILGTNPETPEDVVAFAMTVEAQAMDLYKRAADTAISKEVKQILLNMSWEEKAHLRLLGKLMDEIAGDKS